MIQNINHKIDKKKTGNYKITVGESLGRACSIFAWNYFLLKEFLGASKCKKIIIPIITGYIE